MVEEDSASEIRNSPLPLFFFCIIVQRQFLHYSENVLRKAHLGQMLSTENSLTSIDVKIKTENIRKMI